MDDGHRGQQWHHGPSARGLPAARTADRVVASFRERGWLPYPLPVADTTWAVSGALLTCLAEYGADCVVMVLVWTTLAAALTVHFAAQRDVRLARLALRSAYSTLLVMIVTAVGHMVTVPGPPR